MCKLLIDSGSNATTINNSINHRGHGGKTPSQVADRYDHKICSDYLDRVQHRINNSEVVRTDSMARKYASGYYSIKSVTKENGKVTPAGSAVQIARQKVTA